MITTKNNPAAASKFSPFTWLARRSTAISDLVLGVLVAAHLIRTITDLQNRTDPFLIMIAGIGGIILATLLVSVGFLALRRSTYAAWLAIGAVQLTAFFAILAYSNTVSYFVIIQAALTISIALASLKQAETTGSLGLALLSGLVGFILNTYWPSGRQSLAAVDLPYLLIASIASGLLVLVTVINKYRELSIYLKMLLLFAFITVLPTATVGLASLQSLDNSLKSQANSTLTSAATLTSQSMDGFLAGELGNIRDYAQFPAFVDYLLLQSSGSISDPGALGSAYETMSILRRKNPLLVLSYGLLDTNGMNILDTLPANIGQDESHFPYFTTALRAGAPSISSIIILPDGSSPSIYFSAPVKDLNGLVIGVLRARYTVAFLQQIISSQAGNAGPDSFALLVDEKNIVLANGWDPTQSLVSIAPLSPSDVLALQSEYRLPPVAASEIQISLPNLYQYLLSDQKTFTIARPSIGSGDRIFTQNIVAAVVPLENTPWKVVYFQPEAQYLNAINTQTRNTIVIILIAIIFSVFASLFATRLITNPIAKLSETVNRIEAGDLSAEALIDSKDEIGSLASTFNNMTTRLRDLVGSLEDRVQQRTRDLERRAVQIEAAADVGAAAARLKNIDELLRQTTRLISQRFGFYHVGIFLLDPRGEYAVLRAANSDGGQKMLSRGHQLKVGQTGIVGYVTSTGQPRIALDVGQDATYFDNPDLPNTRSEMALPLIVSGKTLGALDVQSQEEAAFTQEDITTIRLLADQIAIAIDNARLFEESQNAIETARRAYGEISRLGWSKVLRDKEAELAYLSYSEDQVVNSPGAVDNDGKQAFRTGEAVFSKDGKNLHIPIKIRDIPIGVLRLEKAGGSPVWTEEDIAMSGNLVEQLAVALESARLYNDISQRAERETLIADILARMNASIHLETILQTTVEELGRAIQDSEVTLQIGAPGDQK
jgi:GAF domain-containing protein/HAMP domain-containing protein